MEEALRWVTPEHECPHCGKVQQDGWGEREWFCGECENTYILPPLDNDNDKE